MHADLQGALTHINKSWKTFTHNGVPMTKQQVVKCLTYGISIGYESTADFKDGEIDKIINNKK